MTALKTTTRITKTPKLAATRITPSFNKVRDRQTRSIENKSAPVFVKGNPRGRKLRAAGI